MEVSCGFPEGVGEKLPDDWISTPNMIRETGRKVLAMSSRRKVHKEISVYKDRG